MIMKTKTQKMRTGMQVSAMVLVLTLISACASMDDQSVSAMDAATADTTSGSADSGAGDQGKSAEQLAAEAKVKELEQQLASLKVEWEEQKPALQRLVTNEADLEFLVQALADMSQLADEPSRDQYLGQDELTPEKRQESLQALESLVTTQEELNTLLVELSSVVSEVSGNRQGAVGQTASFAQPVEPNTAMPMPTDTQTAQTEQSVMPDSGSATSGQTKSPAVVAQADCNCSSSESSSPVYSDPARSKDTSWYAMTTPYAEATPAGGTAQVSQLDGASASGQPIPGLEVKTFKRRTLPSELAAAGADMQHYAMAPQFHMSRKSLSDYVSQLAFKLAGNQQLAGNRVGVASFVFFDEQLEQTSSVGNQLAEELSTVLPNYGARVIEYKLTREITVGPTGDLSLSRNTEKLRDSQGMDYVLTGTMVPTRRGLQINSRVVSTRDNVVIASASTLIPAMVLQQL
jgi:TolB-like protein